MLDGDRERLGSEEKREGGGGGGAKEKTPARKGYENQKHPLISSASLIFRK